MLAMAGEPLAVRCGQSSADRQYARIIATLGCFTFLGKLIGCYSLVPCNTIDPVPKKHQVVLYLQHRIYIAATGPTNFVSDAGLDTPALFAPININNSVIPLTPMCERSHAGLICAYPAEQGSASLTFSQQEGLCGRCVEGGRKPLLEGGLFRVGACLYHPRSSP